VECVFPYQYYICAELVSVIQETSQYPKSAASLVGVCLVHYIPCISVSNFDLLIFVMLKLFSKFFSHIPNLLNSTGVQEHGGPAGAHGGLPPPHREILPRLLPRGLSRPLGGGGAGLRDAAGGDAPPRAPRGRAHRSPQAGQGRGPGGRRSPQSDLQYCPPGEQNQNPDGWSLGFSAGIRIRIYLN